MAQMNKIVITENEDAQIRLLRARRQMYARAKRLLSLQIVLTVAVPMVGALCASAWPDLRGSVAFLSLTIAILDATVFDRIQRALLKSAAKVQEQFDCIVLELPWDDFSVGERVPPETIHAASSKHLKGQQDASLKDWYPVAVEQVPLHLARIICQRTNLWYDAKLRRQYGGGSIGLSVGLSLLLVVIGMVRGLTLDTFVLTVLAPAAPIIIWGVREYFRQRDTCEILDRLRLDSEDLWERAKTGACSETDCTNQSRQFQNAIYLRRSSSPLIFDWMYKVQRPHLEDQMNRGAEDFVREITG
jgi:SMODS-associating 4TM effector domain